MSKEKKIIGWQISNDERAILNEIQVNFKMTTLSQVLYRLMYSDVDLNGLLEESKIFAKKQITNNAKN